MSKLRPHELMGVTLEVRDSVPSIVCIDDKSGRVSRCEMDGGLLRLLAEQCAGYIGMRLRPASTPD